MVTPADGDPGVFLPEPDQEDGLLRSAHWTLGLALSIQGAPGDPLKRRLQREALAAAIVELEALPEGLQPLKRDSEHARWARAGIHFGKDPSNGSKSRWRAEV